MTGSESLVSGALFGSSASGNAEFFHEFSASFVEEVGAAFAVAGTVAASEDLVLNAFPDAPRERGVIPEDLSTEYFVAVSAYLAAKVTDTVLDDNA